MKKQIFKYLENASQGYLEITTPENEIIKIGDEKSSPKADIQIKDWSMIDIALSKGDIGFGECYIEELFTTSKIENLLLFFTLNQRELEKVFHSNKIFSLFFTFKNLFKKNSVKGSRKNIKYHYDLGNEFYSTWLDETMSYSSGIFCEKNCLTKSQENKYSRILNNLNNSGERILEIGCGWGGFINEATKNNYQVKGLTLSTEQKKYAEKQIQNQKSNSQIALQDYRNENGKFDNIVSIEMFEAVGKEYWDEYFSKIKQCLKKEGKAIIQTITMNDEFYKKYTQTSDFIREHIFPGGLLPSNSIFEKLAKKNGFHILDKFSFASCYNKTLLKWLNNFDAAKDKIITLGYDEKFIKKWRFYLAYCAAGFSAARTDVVQYSLCHD